ncbi:MAG: SusC/RagA family TonB-linked outer membrane protein [Candidatus Paraprevotella stercoravium]|uniref:SusC/RagA family TonB-linked outer membrane protein n=1 Tax=Candidatus Paraprevotella stercoravium TaxID=2838725 RepID=A0A9E2L5F8_9BACT|nr:SusC/RagA family TonB-linked outer membrane protein [Candidatus Paraprevotella stercoravium]
MKKNMNNNFIQSVLRASVCLCALSGANAMMAQDVVASDSTATDSVAISKKKAPQYKMKEVRGKIYDSATGLPMSGVMVQALNTPAYSALTEEDGSYKLEVPVFVHALYVSVPDYNPIQVPIKKDGVADGYMNSSKFKGFYQDGTVITAQNTALLSNTSAVSIESEIQNQLAGDVRSINRNGTPAQGAYMMIRGIHSLNANNQPLIILDGNMIDMQNDRTSLHVGYVNNVLSGLDPEDVESVQVLKNGTALYGAKGANGVILINTKRGKSMATKINVNIFGGVVLRPETIDMMGAEQFRSYLSDLLSDGIKGNASLTQIPFLTEDKDYFWYPLYHNETDWSKDMYRTTMTQNYKVSVEGGDDVAMYNLSLGYAQANSAMENNDFSRLNLRFNTDIKIAKNLSTAMDIAYSRMAYNILDNGWAENYEDQNIAATNVLGLVQTPFLSPYAYYIDENNQLKQNLIYAGKYASSSTSQLDNPFRYPLLSNAGVSSNDVLNNPYWILENGRGEEKNYAELTQFNLNVMPKWQITKQFSISNRFNYALSRNNEKYYLPVNGTSLYTLENLGEVHSVLKSQFTKQTTINNDFRLDWGENYGAHDIRVFGGWRYNNYSYSYSFLKGYNATNDKMPILNYGRKYLQYSGTNDNWSDMAYYANADYNFMNRYFIQASVSAQASSRFGNNTDQGFQLAGVSWGVFPSVQLGWLISSEKWFPATSGGVNYLKLTAGFDQSGNDDINYYAASTYWTSEKYLRESIGLVMKNIDNPKIQWETTTQYNLGLEGSFIKNRLQAGLNFYWANTDHLLVKEKVSYMTGLDEYWTNNGAMKNAGFELNVNAALINKKDWRWQVGATVGHYKNEITELPSSDVIEIKDYKNQNVVSTIKGYTSSIYGEDNVLTAVGHAAGVFYGYQTAGVFASDADAKCYKNPTTGEMEYLKYPTGLTDESLASKNFYAGDVHFVDQNGDGWITEADKVVIGDPNPDIYGNIYTMLNYKRLTLNVNLKYSLGNDVYNYQRTKIEGGNSFYNQSTAMVNRWTYEGQVTDVPRACYPTSDLWRNNERFSDRWIEDGSYLKIKNIRLTYDIPVSATWLQGLKVWGEANDVFTFTKYLGTDPEISASNNILYQGIDNGMMPLTRSFNIGVSINL